METIFYATLFFLYGVVIGSFLNVCIYRLPKNVSVAKGRSFCPSCNHTLSAADLIPLVSFLCLGRKCRYCKEKISPRYFLIELLTGLVFTLIYFKMSISGMSIIYCIFASILIVVSFVDIDTKEIPDRMHIFILALALLTFIFESNITQKLIGLVAISVPMLILAYFTGGFGGGDIKLMAVAGLLIGVYPIVLAFFIGAFLGAIYGVYLLLAKKADKKTAFSFGPYLSAGIVISMLFSTDIINFYLSFF